MVQYRGNLYEEEPLWGRTPIRRVVASLGKAFQVFKFFRSQRYTDWWKKFWKCFYCRRSPIDYYAFF